MKELRNFFLLLLIFTLLERPCHVATHGFNVLRITDDLPHNTKYDWACHLPDKFFATPFRLIDSGSQMYAFSSADNRYILKLCKYQHLRLPKCLRHLEPIFPILKQKRKKREKRMRRLYESIAIAYNDLRQETGLIAAHLSPSKSPLRARLIDKNGIAHSVDLAKSAFAVQHKAVLAPQFIERAASNDKQILAIQNLLSLFKKRHLKGISDKNPDFKTNFGYIGDRPIEIDIGRFSYDPEKRRPHQYRREVFQTTREVRQWLRETLPELVDSFDANVMSI